MREEVFFKNFSHSLRKRFFIAMKFNFVASMVQKRFCVKSLMQILCCFVACKDQKDQQAAFRTLICDVKNTGTAGRPLRLMQEREFVL